MKYELLQTLLPYLEAYERAYPKARPPQHFAVWLLRQTTESEQLAEQNGDQPTQESPDVSIGKLLVYLNRYMKIYARKALEGSSLGTMDEFVYIAMLIERGPLTKSDLIQRNRHEKPTGMEIIRRLLALGLVVQSDDPDDRRSKRLTITPPGMEAFGQVAGQMSKVSTLLTGNLSAAEKMLLLQLLDKLEAFHQLTLAKLRKQERG
ncbi:MAG: MarR family transcriptional regulator [Saprospiraceae bacterium]